MEKVSGPFLGTSHKKDPDTFFSAKKVPDTFFSAKLIWMQLECTKFTVQAM